MANIHTHTHTRRVVLQRATRKTTMMEVIPLFPAVSMATETARPRPFMLIWDGEGACMCECECSSVTGPNPALYYPNQLVYWGPVQGSTFDAHSLPVGILNTPDPCALKDLGSFVQTPGNC